MMLGRTVEHESTTKTKRGVFRVLSFREPMTAYPKSFSVKIHDEWKPFSPSTGRPKDLMPMIAVPQKELNMESLVGETVWFDVE